MVALASQFVVDVVGHLTLGHVPHHPAEYAGADGALGPLVLADQVPQAAPVEYVRAGQRVDVLVGLLQQLLLEGLDLELAQADGALLVLHLVLAQLELERGEEANVQVRFELVVLVLLHDHGHQKLDDVVVLVLLLQLVPIVELHYLSTL